MQKEAVRSSDAEIVRQVLDGNVNAFESLILRHRVLVVTIVKKHVPADAVEETTHEAFVRAYQSLPMFKGTGEFSQWLSSIAVRTCYDHWRKVYRSREIPMSALTEKHSQWLEQVISQRAEEALDDLELQREIDLVFLLPAYQEIMAGRLCEIVDSTSEVDRIEAAKIIGRETTQYVGNIYKYYVCYRLAFATRQRRGATEKK